MKTYFKTQIFSTPYETAERLAMDFIRFVENTLIFRENLYIALSGGSTPQLMYEIIAREFAKSVKWEKLHFFWVDERCVVDSDPESNFGNACRILFSKVGIPAQNLHPVHGADDPMEEVVRYTGEILSNVPCVKNYPCFDLVLLGMGNDGHTASIFPGQLRLFETNAICTVAQHPDTKQKRITLTGKSINNATNIVFLVTGKNKAEKLKSIFFEDSETFSIPAKNVRQKNGSPSWYLDNDASIYINIK